ncbi:MAG: mercury resistance system periplasmic binding protein MerP [Gammaproteobacteria bacterium]
MKKLFAAAVVTLLTILCTSAWAASKTVTLSVAGMTCAACPITIKKALTDVDGVTEAEVSFDKKDAVVTFDDAKTSVSALIEATANTG